MSLVAWTFLFGALAVVGPVAAHLLSKPRYRKVPFTMLRFLRSGQRESHARRRLRDLLILLLRCAVIVLIAVLFAQPMLHVTPKPTEHRSIHYLALDDSMSMAYRDGDETLLERMTDAAIEEVRRAPQDSTFSICALASGRSVSDLNRSQVIAEIERLKPVAKSASLEGFYETLRQAIQTATLDDTLCATVFSDFSPSVLAQFEQVPQPAVVDEIQYEPITPSTPIDNAAIIGARIVDVADNQLKLDITVANGDGAGRPRELTARIGDLDPVVADVTLAPQRHDVLQVQVPLSPSLGRSGQAYIPIELNLLPADGLPEDDSYRIAAYLPTGKPTNLLLVHGADETFLFETAVEALTQEGHLNALELKRVTPDRLASSDLAWANVVVFASLPDGVACSPANIERYLRAGGKLLSFATPTQTQDSVSGETTGRLWQAGLLPALPDKWIDKITYVEPQPHTRNSFDLDDRAAQSLIAYRLDKIAVKGAWHCRVDSDAQCVWRFADGTGFIYGKSLDQGLSLFINTSIDDSLGLLAKSRAWVAFCRYLLGRSDQMRQYCFSTTEHPVLYMPEAGTLAELNVENCDGRHTSARVEGMALRFPAPAGIGWMTTLNGPAMWAPINLPEGETDLTIATDDAIATAVRRTFVVDRDKRQAAVQASAAIERKAIWQLFAWATIALLLAESALANRLKR